MRPLMLFFCAAMLSFVSAAGAQEPVTPPAHISFLEGLVTIEHDGQSEPATMNMPVVEGDRLRTGNGRAEVMFPDGAAIAIDPNSEIEFITGARVRVLAGTIEHRAAQVDPRSPSAQNLPPDLQPYGTDLDRSGAWQYEPSYGNVWYPTVAADWRPYYDGYWAPVPAYGLTWIGYDRWSWPTHHYGRWGYLRNRWFWIPGRTWSTAWVSWGTAPDYVSWCPLGFDDRPIIGLSVGYHRSWNPWTIVPRDRFLVHGGGSVRRYAIDPYRVSTSTPFVVHRRAPSYESRGRLSAADRTNVAVPRYQERTPNPTYRSPYNDDRQRGGYATSTDRQVPRAGQAVPRYGSRESAIEHAPSPRSGYRAPSPQSPAASPEYRAPATGYRVPNTTQRPEYQPQYQPRNQPSYEAPRAVPRQDAPVMRESAPVMRERAPVMREGAPARQAPPPRESAPAYRAPQQQAAPPPQPRAAGPHAESHGQGQGRSEGTAVRRPR